MTYMNVAINDLKKVLSEDEITWASNIRIPYNAFDGEWAELLRIQSIVGKAIASGTIPLVEREEVLIQRGPHIISDYIDGPGGALRSQADGKMYDSKSQYYRSIKEAGCEVMGNDAPREAKPMEAKICENDLKRDIANAIQQLGG